MTNERYAVLRVRTPSRLSTGFPDDRLEDIAAAAFSLGTDERAASEFSNVVVPATLNEIAEQVRARVSGEVVRLAERHRKIMIDIRFESSRWARLANAVANSLVEISESIPPHTRCVILVGSHSGRLLDSKDAIVVQASQGSIFALIDTSPYGSDWPLNTGLDLAKAREVASATFSDIEHEVRARTLRRRGVFKVATIKDAWSMFRYSADPASDAVGLHLSRAINSSDCDIVIWDDDTNEWLGSIVKGASGAVPHFPVSLVTAGSDVGMSPDSKRLFRQLSTLIKTGKPTALLIVPFVKSGTSIRKLQLRLRTLGITLAEVEAVYYDEALNKQICEHLDENGRVVRREISWDHGLEAVSIGAIVGVPFVRTLDPGDWRVRAAKELGEIEDSRASWRAPGRLALWMLLIDSGLARRYVASSTASSDAGFSDAAREFELDPWDYYWVGEIFYRVICDVLEEPPTREDLLLVTSGKPNTPNEQLAQALRVRHGMSVVSVPEEELRRSDFELSDDDARLVADLSACPGVIIDLAPGKGEAWSMLRRAVERSQGSVHHAVALVDEFPYLRDVDESGAPITILDVWNLFGDAGAVGGTSHEQ